MAKKLGCIFIQLIGNLCYTCLYTYNLCSSLDRNEDKGRYVVVGDVQTDTISHDVPDQPMTVPGQISAAGSTEAVKQESAVGGAKQNTQGVSGSVVTNLLLIFRTSNLFTWQIEKAFCRMEFYPMNYVKL